MIVCLDPVFNANSQILILGSFPSVISRKTDFYYGNSRNRFWSMLENIFNEKIFNNITDKKAFILSHNIALWDIVSCCDIVGSSDSALKNIVVNDLHKILNHSKIVKIICNGKKAFEIFNKSYYNLNINTICLPSTSPANIRFNYDQWKENLLIIKGE